MELISGCGVKIIYKLDRRPVQVRGIFCGSVLLARCWNSMSVSQVHLFVAVLGKWPLI